MANPEHVNVLTQGVEVWNEWVRTRRILNTNPDGVRHEGATIGVSSFWADLEGANLSGMDLYQGKAGAGFTGIDLMGADLRNAKLIGTNLAWANLAGATLGGANLSRALLVSATFQGANLSKADINGCALAGAELLSANLREADLTRATLSETYFADTDLTGAIGLDSCIHGGPSVIDYRTLAKSGMLPINFLRGCGLPDTLISYLPSLLSEPIQFYSCFISYSSKDEEFAERLHADLQANGVRVWFAPHDLPIGARIRPAIDESIRVHDKLLLVLSGASVASQWVEQEVETALAREREQGGRTVLFPVRIDDAVMGSKTGWPAMLKNARNIGDFTRWKDHDSYQRAFNKLLRDLKAEETNRPSYTMPDSLENRAVFSPRGTMLEEWDTVEAAIVEAAKRNGFVNAEEFVECGRLINQLHETGKINKAVREEFFFLSKLHDDVLLNSRSPVEPGMTITFVNRAQELQKAFDRI